MTSPHHDKELCLRIASNIMQWDGRHDVHANGDDDFYSYCINCGQQEGRDGGLWEDSREDIPAKGCEGVPDYCCDPILSWLLEQTIMRIELYMGVDKTGRWYISKRMRANLKTEEIDSTVTIAPEWAVSEEWGKHHTHTAEGHPLLATALAIDKAVFALRTEVPE